MRLARALTAWTLLAVPISATAQEQPQPDTVPPARQDTALPTAQDTTTPPRRPYTPPRFAFTLTFGTLAFGDLQSQPVLAERLDSAGDVVSSDTLRRTLAAGGGLQVAGTMLVALTPAWAVRLGAGIGRATFRSEYGGEAEAFVTEAGGIAPSGGTELTLFLGDVSLLFRIPSSRRFQPYALVGGSAVHWQADTTGGPFPGTRALGGSALHVAGLVGLGAVIPITTRLAATIEASARFQRTPFPAVEAGVPVGQGDSLALTFQSPAAGVFADADHELVRVLRLDAGLSLELGRAPGQPAPTVGSGSTSSSSGSRRSRDRSR